MLGIGVLLTSWLGVANAQLDDVPSPDARWQALDRWKASSLAQLRSEQEAWTAQAKAWETGGKAEAARALLAAIELPPEGCRPRVFRPIPAIVAPRDASSSAWPYRLDAVESVRRTAADTWYQLARKALEAQWYALADESLRRAVDRNPGHAGAWKLLGYEPYQGGWASEQARRLLGRGQVLDPEFGWVPESWLDRLHAGQLPAPARPGQREIEWLPADQADALRRDAARPWRIETPHFVVFASVPFRDAVSFARRLETFRELFLSVMADLVAKDRLPLALRARGAAVPETPAARKHQVVYYASKEAYVADLTPREGESVADTLGIYIPPDVARRLRQAPTSYFFLDETGAIDVVDTQHHEVSHQLLFELGGRSNFERNRGHFWVFEGLGTYFETVRPRPDGAIELGGLVGPRVGEARRRLDQQGEFVDLAELERMSRADFNERGDVYLHYADAIALTAWLMDGDGGRYRERFLDYARDVFDGRFRTRGTDGLAERLDLSLEDLRERVMEALRALAPVEKTAKTKEGPTES